jgi:hypothetical protein
MTDPPSLIGGVVFSRAMLIGCSLRAFMRISHIVIRIHGAGFARAAMYWLIPFCGWLQSLLLSRQVGVLHGSLARRFGGLHDCMHEIVSDASCLQSALYSRKEAAAEVIAGEYCAVS